MPPPPAPFERDARDAPLPRSQVRTACAVVGCLSLVVIAALAALVYIVLTVLGDLTPQPNGSDKDKKKATARPDPVAPTALKDERATVALAAPFDAVGRAANGRFLLLKVKADLAVFDPVEAKVVRTFPLGEPNALFAGGAGKLYVYRPKAKELDRFDLLTGEKEETAKKPDTMREPEHLLVGDAVDSPVLAVAAGNTRVDVAVIDPAPAKWAMHLAPEWRFLTEASQLRVSSDGKTIGAATTKGGVVLTFTPPAKFEVRKALTDLRGHVAPSAFGRHLYSAGGVRKSAEPTYTLPAAHGDGLYLSVGVGEKGKLESPLRVHLADTAAVVRTIPATLPTGLADDDSSSIPMDQRIHFWPAAGLLAVLPTSNNRIELTKVDVPKMLKDSGRDHLIFGSEPPLSATRSETMTYKPTVWASPAGAVTFEVTGPAGMTVKDSHLVWPVPPSGDEREVTVELTARIDKRTAKQFFRVLLVEPTQKP